MSLILSNTALSYICAYVPYKYLLHLSRNSKSLQSINKLTKNHYIIVSSLQQLITTYTINKNTVQLLLYTLIQQHQHISHDIIFNIFHAYITSVHADVCTVPNIIRINPLMPYSHYFYNTFHNLHIYISTLNFSNKISKQRALPLIPPNTYYSISINTSESQCCFPLDTIRSNIEHFLSPQCCFTYIQLKGLPNNVITCSLLSQINFSKLVSLRIRGSKVLSSEINMFLYSLMNNSKYDTVYPLFKHLELCLMELKGETIELLGNVICHKFPNIESINLKGNAITNETAKHLINAVQYNKHLKYLDLSFNNQIERYDILKQISTHLSAQIEDIKIIQSQSNEIVDDTTFLNIMTAFKRLRTFDLFEIGDLVPFMKHIAHLPNINELRLLCANPNIVQYLNAIPHLHQLQLINVIDVDKFLSLCDDTMLNQLTLFKMTYTDDITYQCLDKLTAMTKLNHLTISSIDMILLKHLAIHVLPQMKQLTVLDLSQNDICGNDTDVFCNGLQHLPLLKVFSIGNNSKLGIHNIVKITTALRMYCVYLCKLSFQCCCNEMDEQSCNSDEWGLFWEECKSMHCVEKLNLSNNCMCDAYVDGFIKYASECYFKCLKHLNLSFNSGISEMCIWKIISIVNKLPCIEHIMLQECDYIDDQAYRQLQLKECQVIYLLNMNPIIGDNEFQLYHEDNYELPQINF